MFAICIESSHQKGMGHLFRALNFINCLDQKNEKYVLVLNDNAKAKEIVKEKGILSEIVDLQDISSDWETKIIQKYNLSVWINDRLDTNIQHALNVKKNNINLVSFDDTGAGAELADINFGMMPCNYEKVLRGKLIKNGIAYLILNNEVNKYKRKREHLKRIIVTLGGSDTHGVTLKVAERLKQFNCETTIVTGPSFIHYKELDDISAGGFTVKRSVPSLLKEFYDHDFAITGGGITPFEANASGLPCLIIANEPHEIENGQFLHKLGSSIYTGYYSEIDYEHFLLKEYDLKEMSILGIKLISAEGTERVYNEIMKL